MLHNDIGAGEIGAMTCFRIYLAAIWLAIFVYTAVVIANHGANLFPVFFGDMAAMGWPGQFNFDFMFLLSLSALWVAWRHQFTAGGLVLAFLAAIGGAAVLSIYLLVVSFRVKGDVRALVMGART
jgi:hypothetical protein